MGKAEYCLQEALRWPSRETHTEFKTLETLLESNVPLIQTHLAPDGKKFAYRTSRPRETITTLDPPWARHVA